MVLTAYAKLKQESDLFTAVAHYFSLFSALWFDCRVILSLKVVRYRFRPVLAFVIEPGRIPRLIVALSEFVRSNAV